MGKPAAYIGCHHTCPQYSGKTPHVGGYMNYYFKFMTFLIVLLSLTVQANTLSDGIELFNQREYEQARTIFESLSNGGDIEATYWLGASQYKAGEEFKAGHTYLEAAKKGNPWAMDMLVPRDGSPCSYLNWPCDEAWEDKAISIWKQQASDGSGKAMRILLLRESPLWQVIPFYSDYKYNKLFEKAIPLGGYTFTDSVGLLKSEREQFKHLLVAANKDYAPAMVSLFYYTNILNLEERLTWCLKAINLGYSGAASALSMAYSNGSQGVIKDKTKAIYYMFIEENLKNNTNKNDIAEKIQLIIDEDLDGNSIYNITNNDIEKIKTRAKIFTRDIEPNMFLDESSFEMRH